MHQKVMRRTIKWGHVSVKLYQREKKKQSDGPHVCHMMRIFQEKPEYRVLSVKVWAWYCL